MDSSGRSAVSAPSTTARAKRQRNEGHSDVLNARKKALECFPEPLIFEARLRDRNDKHAVVTYNKELDAMVRKAQETGSVGPTVRLYSKRDIKPSQIEDLCEALEGDPRLETVLMNDWDLTDELFARVCRLIESCPNVSSFNAGENDQLTDQSGVDFADFLERTGRCVGFYIGEHKLRTVTHGRIARALAPLWAKKSPAERRVIKRGQPAISFWRSFAPSPTFR